MERLCETNEIGDEIMTRWVFLLISVIFEILSLNCCTLNDNSQYNAEGEAADVYSNEIKKTAVTIASLSNEPCLVYNIMADSHEHPENDVSVNIVNNTYNNIKRVNELCHSHGVVHLGDALTPNNDSLYPDWAKVNYYLSDNYHRLTTVNDKVFYVLGNHDGLRSHDVDEFETYESLFSGNDTYVVREGMTPWYFKDYPDIKTRVAFLAVPCRDMVKNGSIRYGIYRNQMSWIANKVFCLDNGWRVLFFGHINPVHPTFRMESRKVFADLTNAFSSHTSYNNQAWGISVDYSSSDSAILGYISGHAHADAIIEDNSIFTDYNFSFPIVVIAACNRLVGGNSNLGYSNPERKAGTDTEDLWDTMVYRPDLKKIFFVRFGAGNDRVIEVS